MEKLLTKLSSIPGFSLVNVAHIRFIRQHPLQLILTLVGIALGVAVVTAVDLANKSAQRAFQLSLVEILGNTSHQIVSAGATGFEQDWYRQFQMKFGSNSNIRAAPLVEGLVAINDQSYRLLGVDIFAERGFRDHVTAVKRDNLFALLAEPNTILLPQINARRMNVGLGQTIKLKIEGKTKEVKVVGLLRSTVPAATEGLIITDIATAQELLERSGRLDRIDLILPADTPQLVLAIENWLPRSMQVQNTASQSHTSLQSTRAFRINLQAMSLMALLVGGFLIFNTLTFSVLQRRQLIGVLRGLGVTQEQVFYQVFTEAFLYGLFGTLLGLVLGVLLGFGLVKMVVQTINDLYFVMTVSSLLISPGAFIKGFFLGIGISLLAALGPAYEAARTNPVTAQHRSPLEERVQNMVPKLAGVGAAMLLIAVVILLLTNNLVLAFTAMFDFVIGYSLIIPAVIVIICHLLVLALRRTGLLPRLAVRSIPASLSRSAVAVAALTVAVAATIGVGLMVQSFRSSVEQWLQSSLRGDFYISAPASSSTRVESSIPPTVVDQLKHIQGVSELSFARRVEVLSSVGRVTLVALKLPSSYALRTPLQQGEERKVWAAFDRGKQILISEPFANKHLLALGDSIELFTDNGKQSFIIGGILQDYRTDKGMVYIHARLYDRYWADTKLSGIGVYIESARMAPTVRDEIQRVIETHPGLLLHSNKEIRDDSLAIFDRTFTITHVLRLLAIGVAFFGVFSALLAFQLERIREIAVLRATGMTHLQVWGIMCIHTAIFGLMAGLFAIPLGVGLAWALIHVVNKIAFGWTIEMILMPSLMLQGMVLAVFAAIISAIYPAWKMTKITPAEALREE